MRIPRRGLFITGTDTGVGKTYVGQLMARALVAEGRRVGIYKPVASGCQAEHGVLRSDDVRRLCEAACVPEHEEAAGPQRFRAPLAPHLAARAEGKAVDEELLRRGLEYWADRCDIVLVEGAGGLMSPVSDEDYVADLALQFGYPLVVVAANVLGVINQTLQTLITAATFREGLAVAGVVLNDHRPPEQLAADASTETNLQELQARCVPPVLAHVRWQATQLHPPVDWWALAAT